MRFSTFGRAFWGNFIKQSSNFDNLFYKLELTVEDLLDEEDILVEFKQMNPKLLDL